MARILVVGVGGIGGLLATPLVNAYGADVTLVERGERREALSRDGITLHSDALGELHASPSSIVETPEGLPVQDVIFVCVKNTVLEAAAAPLESVVGPKTVIVPVMNGVRAYAYLQERFPEACVLPTVIYTVAYVQPDQSVVQKGNFTTIYTGSSSHDETEQQAAIRVTELLTHAGVECHASDDVLVEVWKKYILNCAFNVIDTYHDCTIGDVKADRAKFADFGALLQEATAVAQARGIAVSSDIVRLHMMTLKRTTNDSTSSLHRDFMVGRSGELEIFSGDIVRMAHEAGVEVPVSERYYEGLQARAEAFAQ